MGDNVYAANKTARLYSLAFFLMRVRKKYLVLQIDDITILITLGTYLIK